QLGGCATKIAAKTGDSSQRPVRIGILWSQAYGVARLGLGFPKIPALSQRISEIDMPCREIRLQADGDSNLGNSLPSLSLRVEHPTQRVVSLGTSGSQLYHLFESGASMHE